MFKLNLILNIPDVNLLSEGGKSGLTLMLTRWYLHHTYSRIMHNQLINSTIATYYKLTYHFHIL